MTSVEIAQFQRRLGLPPDGIASPAFYARLRAFQRDRGLMVNGLLDDPTRARLAALATEGLMPRWFGDPAETERVLTERLGGSDRDRILRFQSQVGLPLTGRVDATTAQKIGDR